MIEDDFPSPLRGRGLRRLGSLLPSRSWERGLAVQSRATVVVLVLTEEKV